jgi:hypothetical protein
MQWLIDSSCMRDPLREGREDMMGQSLPEDSSTALLDAVLSLTKEVRGIQERLDTIYAPREEVAREGRRRAWRFLALAIVIIIVSQGMSMTTISYCFLNPNNQTGSSRVCSLMPGYGQALEQGNARLARFSQLLDGVEATSARSEDNKKRLDDIERRLDALEAKKNG